MLEQPLSSRSISTFEDEHELIRAIFESIYRDADIFTSNEHNEAKNYRQKSDALTQNYEAAIQTEKENYKASVENANQIFLASKISAENDRDFMFKILSEHVSVLEKYIMNLRSARYKISSLRYKELEENTPDENLPLIEAETLTELMCRDPEFIVRRINDLRINYYRFPTNSSSKKSFDKICLEFIALFRKAERLYAQGLSEHANLREKCTQEADKILAEANQKLDQSRQEIKAEYENTKKARTAQYESDKSQLEKKHNNALAGNEEKYKTSLLEEIPPEIFGALINRIISRSIWRAETFSPAKIEPLNITIGSIIYDFKKFANERLIYSFIAEKYSCIASKLNNGQVIFPLTIAINESLALCFKYKTYYEEASDHMLNICMNIFLSTPPGRMRFYFIDPLRSGKTFAAFNHFENRNVSGSSIILSGGILTRKENIQEQLKIATDHINTMLTNTFKGTFKNIREYNTANPLNPQPYHVISIMDFPNGFTNEALDYLNTILTTGREAGVYVIITLNGEQASSLERSAKNKLDNIEKLCTRYEYHDGKYFTSEDFHNELAYFVNTPPEISEIAAIAPIMRKAIEDAGKITIDYKHVAPYEEEFLSCNINTGLSIPIGMSGTDIQYLNLGNPGSLSIHALICGQTGSGKTNLLHAIITGALTKYPADELMIYLVDFKSGTEFKIYADYNLPNFKVIALESEQEFGLSVIEAIDREQEERSRKFRALSTRDINEYNNHPEILANPQLRLPRVLIVIDEFHVLFSEANSSAASKARNIMSNIVKMHRSYGFNVILCSQSLRGNQGLGEDALAQVAVRIALKCPIEDAEIVLKSSAGTILQVEENDPGSGIMVPSVSSSDKNIHIRVADLKAETQRGILRKISDHYTNSGIKANARILSSDVSDNGNGIFQRYYSEGIIEAQDRVLHIGEALRIDAKLEVKFRNLSSNNMMLLGNDIQKAQNILCFSVLDILLQRVQKLRNNERPANIYVMNYCDGSGIDANDTLQKLCMKVPEHVKYYDGETSGEGFEKIYERFSTKTSDDPDDWLIISNLILATNLHSKYNGTENFEKFKKILKEGPQRGVFTIIWCDEPALYADPAKFFDICAQHTELFNKTVVFNLDRDNAMRYANVIDDDSINFRNAYILQTGRKSEKFRPYESPRDEWLEDLCERLNSEVE